MSAWLWRPVNFVQGIYTALWSALWISIALAVSLLSRSPRASLWLARRVWAPGLLAGAGARLAVSGRDHLAGLDGFLVVANHSSWIDIPALFAALPLPLRFVAKQELARVPFLGWYIGAMGMVFVDRADRKRALASVDRATELLAAGAALVSFPEGTRSRDGAMRGFKTAGFAAPIEAQVPVVPVAIAGAGRVLPPQGFAVRPGRIRVAVGEPLATVGLTAADRAGLARETESRVRALLLELAAGAP
ncbi:MAG: lysophospholipid acyltransferase family protein [Thermoanaerobaculia bacterium]